MQTKTLQVGERSKNPGMGKLRTYLRGMGNDKTLLLMTILAVVISLVSGAYPISFSQLGGAIVDLISTGTIKESDSFDYVLFQIRIPRIILGVLVGVGLSISGAAIQGLFRNPLADPSLIGVTSGAMVFAVAGILFSQKYFSTLLQFMGPLTIGLFAFTGALLCTILVYQLSTVKGQTSVATMLLAGIAITALAGSLTGLMIYYSSENELRDLTYWTLGSLSGASWTLALSLAPVVILGGMFLLHYSEKLDMMLLGENEAAYMGVDTRSVKKYIIIVVAIIVGICVAVSGIISFVALVVPHLVRLVRGTLHRQLFTGSALLGSGLIVIADTLSRTIISPAELPIGILTALLGAPFFIYLLVRSNRIRMI